MGERGSVFTKEIKYMRTKKQINRRRLQRRNAGYVKGLRKRATLSEILVANWLLESGINYIFQKGFFVPFHRIVDFYLPKRKIIIEVDGEIHRFFIEKDRNKDESYLKKRGMVTIRITNKEVADGSFKKKLLDFIQR